MLVRDILIFGAAYNPAIVVNPLTGFYDGPWVDISNLVAFSVQVSNPGSSATWIEVSNDPNVQSDGPSGQLAAPSAPTLSQFTYNTGSLGNTGQYPPAVGGLPAQALSIKLTYTTRNQLVVLPTPLYSFAVGETLPSAASAISVLAGNNCQVTSPAKDALGVATGYNVYAQLGGSGPYLLQNGRGGPNASNDQFVYDGPIPLGTPFIMKMGYVAGGVATPTSDTSGGPNAGVNILGAASGETYLSTSTGYTDSPIAVIPDNTSVNVIVAPSSMCWKWLRVRSKNSPSGSPPSGTQAWLVGQHG